MSKKPCLAQPEDPKETPCAFPQGFIDFLRDNSIDSRVYTVAHALPRFIRINPRRPVSKKDLEDQLGTELTSTVIPGLFEMDGSVKIASSAAYKEGRIYGIDLSSCIAVLAMNVQAGDRVLDLCCAPGAKLCYISDLMGQEGEVVGVDVSEHRMNTCRNILTKYGCVNVRTVLGDGTRFSEAAEFDRVIVDAECTHDGSLKHIVKYQKWGWDTLEKRFLNPQRLASLKTLQRSLLRNGFSLLKTGGTLVYSTCSLCRSQNEDIVQWLLESNDEAYLMDLKDLPKSGCEGLLKNTMRFDPLVSKTSGFFLARIGKRPPSQDMVNRK